jgi:hypothetical protein
MTVSVGGPAYDTTQLVCDDALDDENIDTQPVYDARGKRDTTNETDTVITPGALPSYLLQTKKMTDGAMLAWKTLVLRTSPSESPCTVSGSGGGDGGPAGPQRDGGSEGPPPDGG